MAYAINIRSDNSSSEQIRLLWKECGLLESKPSMKAMNYSPHITLAIYDDVGTEELFETFDSAFENMGRVTINFKSLDYFETPDSVILWAAPDLPDSVTSIHEHIHRCIDLKLCRSNYRPGFWIPHCTLATSIYSSRKKEAIDLTKRHIEPIDVEFDIADCASFMPVEVLRERVLPSAT